MPDEKLRLVSLTVLGGALNGRRHDPDEVVTEILIGSDPDCHLVVDLPGVSPIHARVWADLDESLAYDTRAPRGLYVNATRVEGQARIGAGDVLWLGPPQEPDSVCIECHFEPWVEVLPASFVEEAPAGGGAGRGRARRGPGRSRGGSGRDPGGRRRGRGAGGRAADRGRRRPVLRG